MLLTAVPQLHKKWEAGPDQDLDGTGAVSEDQRRERPGRYSRSSLHPLAGLHSRKGRRAQQAAAEHEAAAGADRTDTYLRTHEEIAPLVEVEKDHFVAIPSGTV
jgi:hypothetical protein